MTAERLNDYPKTDLTLSAAPDLLPEDAQAASAIERALEYTDWTSGEPIKRTWATDRLIDYVWPDVITESEARLMDGNR